MRSTGAYLLLVRMNEERYVAVGALGRMRFARGTYVYVGSAMGGLEQRVARHLREEKKRRWHIDHLLASSDGVEALLVRSPVKLECRLASLVSSLPTATPVPGFGCSDCRCLSHLFRVSEVGERCLRSLFPAPSDRAAVCQDAE